MFSSKTKQNEAEMISTSNNIIGKGTLIEGNIETQANIRIEGRVVGNIKTKAKVALGDTAYVEGNVLAQNAEISGEVNGTIEVSDLLILKSSAVIKGDILTNKMLVEAGATFNGSCKMGVEVREINLHEYESARREKTA